jgi:osmoprotectant transport system ATP-binding protein
MEAKQEDVCFLTDEDGNAAGFVTAMDLQKHSPADPGALINTAAARKEFFVQHSLVLRDALSLMLELNTEFLGVLNGSRLTGVISLADIRKHASRKEGD